MAIDKTSLRIVYMGTPDFAVAGLEALLENEYQVVGVVTAPDRPAGRGRKLQASAVKQCAEKHGIPVLQPEKLRSEDFLDALDALKANLQVVVAFRMLPKLVWDMPELGTFNLHASLLPQYRGAAPINWAIINGEKETGVSTFFIDEKIDTGALLLQSKCPIDPEENAGSLHDKLMAIGAALIVETVALIASGKADPQAQPQSEELKEAPKIYKETCRIDWTQSKEQIHNFVRGLSPYPGAWTSIVSGDQQLSPCKVLGLELAADLSPEKEALLNKEWEAGERGIGLVHHKREIWARHADGWLRLTELQIPGKRKMKVEDLLNGWQPEANSFFE